MFIDGRILETLNPYTIENYVILSTCCTHVVSANDTGLLLAMVNAVGNTMLVKTLLSIEAYMKGIVLRSFVCLLTAGMLHTLGCS